MENARRWNGDEDQVVLMPEEVGESVPVLHQAARGDPYPVLLIEQSRDLCHGDSVEVVLDRGGDDQVDAQPIAWERRSDDGLNAPAASVAPVLADSVLDGLHGPEDDVLDGAAAERGRAARSVKFLRQLAAMRGFVQGVCLHPSIVAGGPPVGARMADLPAWPLPALARRLGQFQEYTAPTESMARWTNGRVPSQDPPSTRL